MSGHMTHSSWDELIEYLQTVDHPKCYTVNYLPDSEEYELWIGNQPYYTYERLIELEQEEKQALRDELKKYKEALENLENELSQGHPFVWGT